MLPVLIIQNTYYHFETAIALYRSLEIAGFEPHIFRSYQDKDRFDQDNFIARNSIRVDQSFKSYAAGFVVSCYPNRNSENQIPNRSASFLERVNHLLYICHRVCSSEDLSGDFNRHNCLFLHPSAESLGLKLFRQFEIMGEAPFRGIGQLLNLGIQGHFDHQGRESFVAPLPRQTDRRYQISLIGSGADRAKRGMPENSVSRENISELDFYKSLSELNFLLPSLTSKSHNGEYLTERYSSTFGLAVGFRKPIFCHEIFKGIYSLPGIYFNDDDYEVQLRRLIDISGNDYNRLIDDVDCLAVKWRLANTEILEDCIKNNDKQRIGTPISAYEGIATRLINLIEMTLTAADPNPIDCYREVQELVELVLLYGQEISLELMTRIESTMFIYQDLLTCSGFEIPPEIAALSKDHKYFVGFNAAGTIDEYNLSKKISFKRIRNFSPSILCDDVVNRAIDYAKGCPSLNGSGMVKTLVIRGREATEIIDLNDVDKVRVKNSSHLILLAVDGFAYKDPGNRDMNVDAGMMLMALSMGFQHSGVGCCPLSWNRVVRAEIQVRKMLAIAPHFIILSGLAVGNTCSESWVIDKTD